MEHHLLRQTYQEDGGRPECKCHEYFSFGRKKQNSWKNLIIVAEAIAWMHLFLYFLEVK